MMVISPRSSGEFSRTSQYKNYSRQLRIINSSIFKRIFTRRHYRGTASFLLSDVVVPLIANHHVLVVDDDQLICWALEKELASKRVPTKVVGTGEECLSEIRVKSYDLLFLDIHLPDSNGIELLKEIRKISPDTKVVIFSADGNESNKESALAEGAVQFLGKPFDRSTIARALQGAFPPRPESRRHARYLCNIRLSISSVPASSGALHPDPDPLDCSAEDVGHGGLQIATESPLRKGRYTLLRVVDADDPFSKFIPANVTAQVMWIADREGRTAAGLKYLS